jgi:hypothetical protein
MAAAKEAALRIWSLDADEAEEGSAVISLMCKVILAERQRCAEIAKATGASSSDDWPGETWIADRIADAILNPTKTGD